MNKTSTHQELLRYAYNETGMADADRIQRTIDGDPLIADDYKEIIEVLEMLDSGKQQPSEKTVKAILEKAKI